MLKTLQKCGVVACAVTALLAMPSLSKAQSPGDLKTVSRSAKITSDLLSVQQSNGAPTPPPIRDGQIKYEYVINGNMIAIEAVASDMNGEALLAQLQALGLTQGVAFKSMIFGFLPIDKLDDLKNVASLNYARPYYKPENNVGKVTSQGDKALRADLARQTYGVTGAGSKVGVISDSYNVLGGAAAGVASGDLPANVQIIDDFSSGTDEGRAMAEIVHDVAPGAAIAFNTANRGQAGFAKGIIDLAAAGCNIIVDDIIYLAEPFFQDGIVGQAADQVVVNNNVTYFSSAGNRARQSYQAKFANSGINIPGYGVAHDFGGGDIYQKVTVANGGTLRLVLQWDQPFRSVSGGVGARTDLDILFFRNGVPLAGGGTNDNIASGDPVEVTGTYTNTTGAPVDIDVVIVKYAGPDPSLIKWVNFGSRTSIVEYDTRSGASYGHNSAARAISVAATAYFDTPAYNPSLSTAVVEVFSSAGGTPTLFDAAGNRISQDGIIRQKPEITSVDGGNNTFFSSDYEPDGFPNFFGTSAAAPHAAAVAALMQERAKNTLSPSDVLSKMTSTALDMDDPLTPGFDNGFDYRTGYGFIQADKAIQASGSNEPIGITSFTCNTTNSMLTSVDFVVGYPNGTFTPALPPLFINGVTGSGQLGVKYNYPFDNNQSLLPIQDAATRSTYFVWNFREACATNTTPNQPPVFNGVTSLTGVVGTAFRYNLPPTTFTDPESQSLTFATSGLPAGLGFEPITRVISGTPTSPGTSQVTVTATDTGGLVASGTFTIAISQTATQPQPPASLTITSYSCNISPTGLSSVNFVVGYTTGGFIPALPPLLINGVTGQGQLGVQYTYTFDNNQYVLPIQDAATGSTYFVWNFRAACGTTPVANRPPIYNGGLTDQVGTVGVPFSYTIPANAFTDPDGQATLRYSAVNLPAGLTIGVTSRVISGTPTTVGTRTVTVRVTDASSATAVGTFVITIGSTPPATFAIASVNTISCVATTPSERQVTFTPQYSGTNGQPITFSVVNETVPTTAPGPYTLRLYTDNPTVTLRAQQAGTAGASTFAYNWLAACNTAARVGIAERQSDLTVTLMANPVPSQDAEVEVRGATGQALDFQVFDEQGRSISKRAVSQAAEVERQTLQLGHTKGLYLLKVNTATQTKTVRILKN
ncbi:putative Ig domain-containing protein [Spirosoma oryzicola]|uniref:putative Ig domain-containing protein n=1 Tax=Spirosoma oryzicola TaxID=2898794 RepID=UPI001E5BAE47|nr:putative Ig domain-containing protein [Spirosoma oryzicola]UHG92494.1 putative Ig domain-containing protein [Spirosoma oryzicola]